MVGDATDDGAAKATTEEVTFDCDFETGNMEAAYSVQKNVYEVWLRNDSNGTDLMWFHFRMRNHNYTGKVKIRIVNIHRDKNLL